jgi:hypothetical protein
MDMNIHINIIMQMKYSTLLHLRLEFTDLIQNIYKEKQFL